ncbi:MAG: MarR family transcriptional regulator [Lachnoclostridium sp.]|jgi:DNA-binding MarR family transcriptional regulator|nr:MarR family transcriptional regulator [Lachnoclostridium sp.]
MKSRYYEEVNHFLVKIFNDVLKIEEQHIQNLEYSNLSLREIHILETIGGAEESSGKTKNMIGNSATSIANALYVTPGTLTTAITLLVKKGFVYREKDEKDRRVIRIYLTELGRSAMDKHIEFHKKMTGEIISVLSEDEISVLCRSLEKLREFFNNKYFEKKP